MFVGGLEVTRPSLAGPDHLASIFDAIAEGLVRHNQMLVRHRVVPRLYDTRVVYDDVSESPYIVSDTWCDALTTWRRGKGDCKLLSAWRAAELREQGWPVKVAHRWQCCPRNDDEIPWLFHAVVVDRMGRLVDDPSARLGMLDPYRRR